MVGGLEGIEGLGQTKNTNNLPSGANHTIYYAQTASGSGEQVATEICTINADTVLAAPDGYLIDSYILSPDKTQAIVRMIEHKPTPSQAQHVVVDLNHDQVTPLFTEALGEQTKYPLFWSKATGRIYFDTYSNNKGGIKDYFLQNPMERICAKSTGFPARRCRKRKFNLME